MALCKQRRAPRQSLWGKKDRAKRHQLSPALYLQPPDAGALLGGLLHGAVHQGDEHVEQKDVGEDDIADEEHVEDLLVLVVLGELHVAHADGELEELHRGVGDVSVAGLETTRPAVALSEESGLGGVVRRRLDEQGDHRWDNT